MNLMIFGINTRKSKKELVVNLKNLLFSITINFQKKYKVISVPTLIVFDNGIEVSRFEPNIMMKLMAEKKEVQATVDEITLNKFQ